MVKKITPVLFAGEIEPSITFWVDRLGFEKTMEVPEGDKLGFAAVRKGEVELMYQSYASGEKDAPGLAQLHRRGPTFLFVEVENLAEVMNAVKGAEVSVPERTTSYGSREYGIKDPAGHVILFAQFSE
jgi:uncharacterized glyoxalase superfamily protein PhnB